jgi:hypothetical protein
MLLAGSVRTTATTAEGLRSENTAGPGRLYDDARSMSTNIQQMVLAVEAELKGRKIPVSDLTTEAGIAPSTWSRWKSGDNSPTLKVWTQALDAKARLMKRGKRGD